MTVRTDSPRTTGQMSHHSLTGISLKSHAPQAVRSHRSTNPSGATLTLCTHLLPTTFQPTSKSIRFQASLD